ncbi:type VI secretion system accessory protein TagJ [Limoniibacter endophyticus]|uniref:Type VI secretion system protein ImpE n=1 Tax=Limoniibacter endophyticus TaxID=1565040 RepID=A0A8J3DRH0_9HYPH|nr:type VI secretion system accessory protein TagJ [Limoniibacter endophyticus]GHC69512.1 hypothetical protein GCM10010136_15430 [Limoniibacter endophyticus]
MKLSSDIAAALSEDRLSDALTMAKEHVMTKPADTEARHFYIDLLMLSGEYEKADAQCNIAVTFSPGDTMGFAFLRNQLRGIAARNAWFETGAMPQFPHGPDAVDQAALKLNLAHREGEAGAALQALEEARGTQPMLWNGKALDDLRDLDDRTPHILEIITTGGAYLWIGLAQITSVRLEPIARPRDFAFRRGQVAMHDGASADVLIPAIYPGTAGNAALLLGRETDWIDEKSGIVTGRGQRSFLAGDEIASFHDLTLLEAVEVAHG